MVRAALDRMTGGMACRFTGRTTGVRRAGRALLVAAIAVAASACSSFRGPPEQPDVEAQLRVAPPEHATPPADPPPDELPTDVPPPPPEGGLLERSRENVRSTTEWLARGLDSWFGDKPWQEGGQVTDGRLSLHSGKRESESPEGKIRFNARVRLPNLEERAYVFVGRDNEREGVTDTPEALSRQDRLSAEGPGQRSFFAGIGVAVRDAVDVRLGFRGVRPYGQARYRRPWRLGDRDVVEFRQTFFWRLSDRFGSTTALSYEHAFSSDVAVRWLTATTTTQRSRKFDWSTLVGLYKSYSGERLAAIELVGSGSQGTGVTFSDYGLQLRWLQPIYRDWLFGEIIVGHFWPRPDETDRRGRSWALGGSLTMRF
jgi:hypothetical protein